ncbi:MAG: hypothetical protein ABR924_22955, partial [Terracidiphilus sp.]
GVTLPALMFPVPAAFSLMKQEVIGNLPPGVIHTRTGSFTTGMFTVPTDGQSAGSECMPPFGPRLRRGLSG